MLIETKGFRAPYNKIDKETFDLLKEYNFSYDATLIENLPLNYPEPTLAEIKISSIYKLPLIDSIYISTVKLPPKTFSLVLPIISFLHIKPYKQPTPLLFRYVQRNLSLHNPSPYNDDKYLI